MTRTRFGGPAALGLLAIALVGCSDEKTGESGDAADSAAADADTLAPQPCGDQATCDDGDPCTSDRCEAGYCFYSANPGPVCDDGDACTEGDVCQANGQCAGTAVDVPRPLCATCTCDPTEGVVCVAAAVGTSCNDGDCCTPSSRCAECDPESGDCPDFARVCEGTPDACEDGNACTADRCSCDEDGQKVCAHDDVADGTACEADPNACTADDTCQDGHCVIGSPLPLDDGNPCTIDRCVKGEVVHDLANSGQCDDGNECTTDDHCALGVCVGGPAVECAKPECASSVSCVPAVGCVPVWKPAESVCDDGDACTTGSVCDAAHDCVPSATVELDDGDACTVDSCDPATGEVTHLPIPMACDDDANPCTVDACDPQTGACGIPLADGSIVADGDLCDGLETCVGGQVKAGAAVDCSEVANPCLRTSCNPATGACDLKRPDGTSCADDNLCDGAETCQDGACTDAVPVDCSGVDEPCLLPQCNPATGVCDLPRPDGASCADDDVCDGAETCHGGECRPGAAVDCSGVDDPCLRAQCNPATGACDLARPDGTSCADDNLCDGAETCQSGACAAADPVDCGDVDDPCLLPQCNPATGACDLARPDGASCADDDLCDGAETCVSGTCQPAAAIDCGDVDDPCLVPQCNPATGVCDLKRPDGSSCADDDLCDGAETCQSGQCAPADPVDCSGVTDVCLQSACNPATGACDLPVADGTSCADVDLCDGAETCQAGVCADGPEVDCTGVTDPCLLPKCNDVTGQCDLPVADGNSCADDDLCDGDEVCQAGLCMDGDPVDCSSVDDPCLVAQCNINTGACDLALPDETSCADGELCDGDEVCRNGACEDVAPVDCSGVDDPCLQSACNPATGGCDLPVDDNTSCADGELCDGDETCQDGVCTDGAPVDCGGVTNPCLRAACNPATGGCDLPVDDDTSCADGDPCDGDETCQGGVCTAGTPVTCPDDGNPCTLDSCDPATGGCGVLVTSEDGELILQPGPDDSLDKYVGSVYDSDPDGVKDHLVVGGWGDSYYSYLRFDLTGIPAEPTGATIWLYPTTGVYNPTGMYFDRVDGAWSLTTSWGQQPGATNLGTVPAATTGVWYALDVTALATAWLDGSVPNWGVRLRPQGTSHQFNDFYSADYAEDPSLRPYLSLTYDCSGACGSPDDCPDDGDPCTAETCTEAGCERVWTCVTTTPGTVAYEVVPALDGAGRFHTAGRVVPVDGGADHNDPHRVGKSYALSSDDLSIVWGPQSNASNCAKNAGPKQPAIDDTLGYVYTQGDWNDGQIGDYCASIFAKRTDTGAAVWDTQPSGPHPRHPVALSDTHAYYGGWTGTIRAFDIATGAITATMNLSAGSSHGGGIVLTSDDDMIATQRSYEMERWTVGGTKVWSSTAITSRDIHMTLGDNVVGWSVDYTALVYVDGATGQEVWSKAVEGGNGGILTDAAGDIYYGLGDGAASVDATGAERWHTVFGEEATAQLLGDDGRFYVRTWSTLYALETTDGSVAWRLDAVDEQVSVEGESRDNGFSGTFGLLANGDLFASDYAGRTYRLATAGLDYAAAPWARPRGNRRNSGKIWDLAPLSPMASACGLPDGVDDTITRDLDGETSTVGARAALYDSYWSSGGGLVRFGDDLWTATGVSYDCLNRWWGTKTTRFTHGGGDAPESVTTACEAEPESSSIGQVIASGPTVALCYQTHNTNTQFYCGRWDGGPGSWVDTGRVGTLGRGELAASDEGFAVAFTDKDSDALTLHRFDASMDEVGATSLTATGVWRALTAVGDAWWAVRATVGDPPYSLAVERFDADGAELGSVAIPAIGVDAATASPRVDAVGYEGTLYAALGVGSELYLLVVREDGTVGARRLHQGLGDVRAELVALDGGEWAVVVLDVEDSRRTLTLLRVACDGTILEGPHQLAQNALVNLRGAALDATGQGLWLIESEKYSGNNHHVWARRLLLP